MTKARLDGNYPGLNGLSYLIGYLEQLLAILSEPLLIGCASLAVIDFITAGRLLQVPAIMYLWAGSLAVAVSATFIVTWRKCIRAFAMNAYGAGIGLAVLGLALGAVDWAAVDTQSLMQTLGVSFLAAIAQLNLNIIILTHLRSGVAIAMAVVVAISNHTAVTTAQRPARRLLFVEALLDRIAPIADQVESTIQPAPQALLEAPHAPENLPPIFQGQFASKEQEIIRALQQSPHLSDAELAQICGCHIKTAAKWSAKYKEGLTA